MANLMKAPRTVHGVDWRNRLAIIRHPRRWQACHLVGGLLALAVLWAPLPFGSVTPGAATALQAGAFLLFAAAVLATREARRLRAAGPALALVGLALMALAQSLPWPAPLVSVVSPEHARLHREAAVVLEAATGEPAAGGWWPLSVAPDVSRRAAAGFLALAAAFAAAALVLGRLGRRWLAAALAAGALFQIVYGARRFLVGATTIWGEQVRGGGGRLRGTFVNPNHLATFLLIVLPVLFAWGWWALRRARRTPSLEQRLLLVAPPVLLWAAVCAGLAFTGSRAGLAAGVVATVATAVVGAGRRRAAPMAAAALVVAAGAVAATGLERLWGRMADAHGFDVAWSARGAAYRAAADLWLRFPWTGTGAGTFREAFPLVQPAAIADDRWRHAHNDPLELLATLGVIGALVLAGGLWVLLRRLRRGFLDGRRSEDRAAALAGFGVLCGLAVQELFDFGLTLPGNAFVAVVVLGAAAAVSVGPRAAPGPAPPGPPPPATAPADEGPAPPASPPRSRG